MTTEKKIVAAVLGGFAALNVWVMATSGVQGLAALVRGGNAWALLLTVDLCISLALVIAWMWRDARGAGRAVLPYLLVTVAAGSIGPLLYLLRRRTGPGRST